LFLKTRTKRDGNKEKIISSLLPSWERYLLLFLYIATPRNSDGSVVASLVSSATAYHFLPVAVGANHASWHRILQRLVIAVPPAEKKVMALYLLLEITYN
jgi:hypothetical protein